MASEHDSTEFEKLWQNQPSETPRISIGELRDRMHRFERKIFWRNIREYIAGVFVVAGYAYYEWKFSALLMRIGSGLTIAAALYVMYQLHRRASSEPAPGELGRATYIAYHRRELLRQRDALRSVWSWYLLPFVPGFGVFLTGLAQSAINNARFAGYPLSVLHVAEFVAGSASFVIVVFVGVWLLNRSAAGRLQAQIDGLDAMARDPD